MKLIFEKSFKGRGLSVLPACDVPEHQPPEQLVRRKVLHLAEISETDLGRHYTDLAKRVHGVNCGFYPLGSCTMKYNPRINEEIASLPGFADIHPLQPKKTIAGCMEVLNLAQSMLCEITGMDHFSFQPAAGAHGEFTGLLLIKAYHSSHNDLKRNKILVPDSAHGTNPASAAMCGFSVVNIPSTKDGMVDIEKLREAAGEDTAGLMLTNPNTVGLFDQNIAEVTKIVHDAGGLNYYDGANMNAIMGIVRPGDMGFDVVHLNLHKTFSTPHGGGGPGSGPVGCKTQLSRFLPSYRIEDGVTPEDGSVKEESIGRVRSFYGNFLVVVRALTYMLTLGSEGLKNASESAVLNANYLMWKLKDLYPMAYSGTCMHEFVITAETFKKEKGISALDIAKTLLDYGIHPPTMYFPLIVHEALMVEPTETESKDMLDDAARIFCEVYERMMQEPELLHQSPVTTPIGRPDEVAAARNPKLRYEFH